MYQAQPCGGFFSRMGTLGRAYHPHPPLSPSSVKDVLDGAIAAVQWEQRAHSGLRSAGRPHLQHPSLQAPQEKSVSAALSLWPSLFCDTVVMLLEKPVSCGPGGRLAEDCSA